MTNKLITIVVLSLGMIATQKSADLWDKVKAASTPVAYVEHASHLFKVSASLQKVYPSPEVGSFHLPLSKNDYGMLLTRCTDQQGEIWAYVVIKKLNGKYATGWTQAKTLQGQVLRNAPKEWRLIHKKWGWESDTADPVL